MNHAVEPGYASSIESGGGDRELAERIAAGDEAALTELIRRYSGHVAGLCRRICRDESDVNDLVSEVFWELWCRAGSFDANRSNVRTFLLLVARSRAIDRRRSSRARLQRQTVAAQDADKIGAESPEVKQVLQAEESQLVHSALNHLDASQRQVIELAFFDGLTHEQVARQLGAPLGTIKSRIRSGLLQLKRILARDVLPGSRR